MSAVLSECGLYRYRLERSVNLDRPFEPRSVAFVGVNPSTADAVSDDPTIRKMVGFARQWGYSRIFVGNLFAYRAADVRELRRVYLDPFGAGTLFETESVYLLDILQEAELLVPCWGDRKKLPRVLRERVIDVLSMLRQQLKPVCHLGLTAGGDPKHPLYLPYSTELQLWE